ncbi:MAG TPA: hypothetical protein VEC99_08500 [Clostridia bacterium]|nr:hypothetical protein [Clostridia bacterium]
MKQKTWWTWVGIGALAPLLLWAGDYRLEEYVGTPGDPVQNALGMPHNAPEVVSAEINDRSIRELLARAAGVTNLEKTEGVKLVVTGDGTSRPAESRPIYDLSHYTLCYPTVEARELFSEKFQAQIKKYLTIRLTGHTRDFAVASFSRPKQATSSQPRSIDVVLNAYREVPEPWLKLWKEDGKAVGYYLVDGELAWTFRFMGQFPRREVVDAQEFDPKLKDVFANARKKAEGNLQARGVVRKLGYCHAYWAELKKVLQEDHKIRWWSPTDLNGGVYD